MSQNSSLRRFYGLLKQAGALANKEDILAGFGVNSAKDLTEIQINEICIRLQEMVASKENPTSKELRRQRSIILTLCTDLGVFNGRNWPNLNAFLQQPRIAGKLLYECTEEELKALATKLRGMLRKRHKAQQDENNIARFN